MVILRSKDISKMSNKEREEKIKDLKTELMREKVSLGKGGKMKVKEIKKTIARLHTFNRLNKSVDDK
jgi:ribosomal protein L29